MQYMFWLVKNIPFPERLLNVLFVMQKWCLKFFELNRHISENSLLKITSVTFLRMKNLAQYHW